jgi:CRISPR-associated protein Cas5t
MTGLHVTVPIACFRKGMAREYLETEPLPPPATCYGFLLSLVGEIDRHRHIGCRVTAGLIGSTRISVVLRTVWRVKEKASPQGSGTNARPDYQQLLTGGSADRPFIELVMWLDSAEEMTSDDRLEDRVRVALDPNQRSSVSRFGGLSLGESAHMVDSVSMLDDVRRQSLSQHLLRTFELHPQGALTLPVWVDHVGSRGTRYATGSLMERRWPEVPATERIPMIRPD